MSLKNSKSKEVINEALEVFPGGVNSPVRAFKAVGRMPFVVEKGEGAYLYDLDGNKYIDYINSWGPLVLGHANSRVVKAIEVQAKKGTSYGASCELELKLGQLIQKFVPSLEMLRFVSSGTEAGMSVIRLARAYTKRNKIIKFSGCYHGHADSLLANAGSGLATFSIASTPGIPEQVIEDTLVAEYNNANSVEELYKKFPGQIAAIIVEPVPGNMGFVKPESGFLQELRNLADTNDSLLIFDEVMSGFRVSLSGAQGIFGVTPDLTMLGKVIGGGLPVGAFGGRKDIMKHLAPLGDVYQAGTLSGNPLAMAAGLATLKEWTNPGIFSSVRKETTKLAEGLKELAYEKNIPFTSCSIGTMFGFSFQNEEVTDYNSAKKQNNELFIKFFQGMLNLGVYFAPSAFEAGFVSTEHVGSPIKKTLDKAKTVFSEIN